MRMTFLASLLVTVPGVALAEPLTFEAAVERAGSEAPIIRADQASVEARRSAAIAADQLPDPMLSAGIENLPVTGPEFFDPTMMTMLKIGVEQDIPHPVKRRAQAGLADSAIGLAEARLGLDAHHARIEAGEAWIDLAYAQQRLEIANKARFELTDLVPLANTAVASGSARPAEALDIRRALIELDDAVNMLEVERDSAKAMLARFLTTDDPVAVGPSPNATLQPEEQRPVFESNPVLEVWGAETRLTEAGVRIAEAERRPDFGVSVGYGVRERRYGDVFSVMGSVTLPIFQSKRQRPRIDAAEAEAAAARARQDDQRRQLAAQFAADLAVWRSAVGQWMRARDELLRLARDRVSLETASFTAGRASLPDVIEARAALALMELEVLAREAEATKAATTIRLTYGEAHR